MVIPQRF